MNLYSYFLCIPRFRNRCSTSTSEKSSRVHASTRFTYTRTKCWSGQFWPPPSANSLVNALLGDRQFRKEFADSGDYLDTLFKLLRVRKVRTRSLQRSHSDDRVCCSDREARSKRTSCCQSPDRVCCFLFSAYALRSCAPFGHIFLCCSLSVFFSFSTGRLTSAPRHVSSESRHQQRFVNGLRLSICGFLSAVCGLEFGQIVGCAFEGMLLYQ